MFAGANPQEGNPPGFFHGQYGGPRTVVSRTAVDPPPKYSFLKPENENHPPSKQASGSHSGPDALSDEILEGCINLFELTGKRVQVILRDSKNIVGKLSSIDHFNNLILSEAVERIIVGKQYSDIARGVFIVRGDNIALLGEIDDDKEADMERILEQVPTDEILVALQMEQNLETEKQKRYTDALKQRGIAFPRKFEEEF